MSTSSILLERPRRTSARRARRRGRLPVRFSIEPLELRSLLNASTPGILLTSPVPNETIDQAWDLGSLSQPATALGSIGTGPDGAADVAWYHFELQDASQVDLTVSAPVGRPAFDSVLSLFNNDPYDFGDPYDLDGHRLLAQVQANPQDGLATYSQDLGPGEYFVAISGAGNTAYSPVLAGSGYPGTIGVYELTASATDLGLSGDGPTMLWSDPAAGAVLDSSPLAIRIEMSGPLDSSTIVPGQTVQLLSVSDGVETPVALASVNFSATADELQLFPQAPLAPGQYVVELAGNLNNPNNDQAVLANPDGTPLGEDAQNPFGTDESFTFQVNGVDGIAGATASDDTAATANDLGNITGDGIVQVSGAIGVDPNQPENPANQVDLYQFQISGPGPYAMLAEVFAGRIGSPLNPGISLFELDPSDGQLVFIAGNTGTLNPALGTDGLLPLYTDPFLSAGLTAGVYYLAVADSSNTPDPLATQPPDSSGIFDPNQPGSAQNGWSTGSYLLNLMVLPPLNPPRVVSSSPYPGQVLGQAPTQITVQFSEPVNVSQLAVQAYEVTYDTILPQVFIEGSDGTIYYARFLDFDRTTNTATFQMLDGLPDGSYTLHLSGPGGLTDLAGNPLPGNDPSGDYVIPFSVQGPDHGISGSMSGGYYLISQAGQGVPQNIGVLFPDELQTGVSVERYSESDTDPGALTTQDSYVIQVLQTTNYSFQLIGDDLPAGSEVTLTDASGQSVFLSNPSDGQLYFTYLPAGIYTVSVGGWAPGAATNISYQLLIKLNTSQDNAPALLDGPAPALQISLNTSAIVAGPPAPEGPITSSGLPTSGSNAAGPPTVGPIGGSGAVAPIGGESGTGGSSAGAGSATLTNLPAATFAQTEAATGLTGLGMGPLGGSASLLSGPLASPTIQVSLNVPSTAAPASNALAVSLVTLTQTFSWNHDGEGTAPVETPSLTVDDANEPRVFLAEASATANTGPSVGADEESATSALMPSTPALALAIQTDPPGSLAAVEPGPPDDAPTPGANSPAFPAGDEATRHLTGKSAARWIIAAATLAVVFRACNVIRGLEWNQRRSAGVEDGRSDGPSAPPPPHAGTTITHVPGQATSKHARRTRSRRGGPHALPHSLRC
jgi:methionine-rich copper-binding protein CopC